MYSRRFSAIPEFRFTVSRHEPLGSKPQGPAGLAFQGIGEPIGLGLPFAPWATIGLTLGGPTAASNHSSLSYSWFLLSLTLGSLPFPSSLERERSLAHRLNTCSQTTGYLVFYLWFYLWFLLPCTGCLWSSAPKLLNSLKKWLDHKSGPYDLHCSPCGGYY